ncbi:MULTISPECIES: discoidin domain-containing protein [unclassified Lysinibacillus]|uniref:discoidin domain-containing protein n=1 Tax=unclassified Lysinibacillus TaxID=2636778 RepID=UPI0038253A4E
MTVEKWFDLNMTTNLTPYPLSASASSEIGGLLAYQGLSGGTWQSRQTASDNPFIIVNYGRKVQIKKMKFLTTRLDNYITAFEIHASNDGQNFIKIHVESGISFTEMNVPKEFYFNKGYIYQYYKLIAKASNSIYNVLISGLVYGGIDYNPDKLVLQNGNSTYSLSDNTLIHMPDNSPKNMILHGIEQGKEIQLDVPFDKHRYFNDTPVANVNGKVFTHDIGKINTLNIKEITENKSFVTTWYDTKMIDDNTPSPLVASASSVFSTTYSASKAFDLDNATYWTTLANQHQNSWLMIDLGASKDINVVKLTPSSYLNETPITFIIEASDNGNDWTKVLDVVGFKNWTAGVPVIFNMNQTSSRYIRITHKESLALQGGSWFTAWGEVAYGLREVK